MDRCKLQFSLKNFFVLFLGVAIGLFLNLQGIRLALGPASGTRMGPVRQVFRHPAHPYTQALLASVPRMDEKMDSLVAIDGQPPALDDLPSGCRFTPRCAYADDRCTQHYPPTSTIETGHTAACWRLETS